MKPLLRWPGGKGRHLKHLLGLIPAHQTYCEVFAGGLAVLLAKERSKIEVVNDLNSDLVALYRNVRFHHEALVDELEFSLNSRRDMEDFAKNPGLTEIQRAAHWLMINRVSWGGGNKSFGGTGAKCSRKTIIEQLIAVHERLDRVVVECLPFERCLELYDRPHTFFFIDPPYLDAKPSAYAGWTEAQMTSLRGILDELKGKWVLTVDDSPGTRRIFAGLTIRPIVMKNGMDKHAGQMGELIITPKAAK